MNVGKSGGLNVEKEWEEAGWGKPPAGMLALQGAGENRIRGTQQIVPERNTIVNVFVGYHSNGAVRC
jgi:hypothetical protein